MCLSDLEQVKTCGYHLHGVRNEPALPVSGPTADDWPRGLDSSVCLSAGDRPGSIRQQVMPFSFVDLTGHSAPFDRSTPR